MVVTKTCPKCGDCAHMDHHWRLACPDPDDPEDDRYIFEAVAAWRADLEANPDSAPLVPVYLVCGHCGEWKPFDDQAEKEGYWE